MLKYNFIACMYSFSQYCNKLYNYLIYLNLNMNMCDIVNIIKLILIPPVSVHSLYFIMHSICINSNYLLYDDLFVSISCYFFVLMHIRILILCTLGLFCFWLSYILFFLMSTGISYFSLVGGVLFWCQVIPSTKQ